LDGGAQSYLLLLNHAETTKTRHIWKFAFTFY